MAANAGSGKTHVLAQRVINLLLEGVEPEKILCITFTKAAAANMAKRVFDTLGAWTKLDDEKLDKAISEARASTPVRRTRTLARRLFARALETPGGLKVQTIHAFCTQLLHQFPFEANVAARFSVLDDAEQTQMLEALDPCACCCRAREAPQSPLGEALAVAMTAGADQTFRDVVRGAIGRGDAIRAGSKKAAASGPGAWQRCPARSASTRRHAGEHRSGRSYKVRSCRRRNGRPSPQLCQAGSASDQKTGGRLTPGVAPSAARAS